MSANRRYPFEQIATPDYLRTNQQKKLYIRRVIDAHGFNWRVWEVTASGFFTDSYNLFATNVILPSLAYVYWPDQYTWRETLINSMTLGGSLVGQLTFGFLADKYGRTRLYGVELAIVICATIVVSATSAGFGGSLSPLVWITIFRFVMGVGIGGEYPLSAGICVEWASTKARGRMIAAVFLMQPVGQLFAQLVGLWVLIGYDNMFDLQSCTDPAICAPHIDSIWRWVTGVGAIPAVVAIIYRFLIRDPGLYDLDVKNQGDRAVKNTERHYRVNQSGMELREMPANVARNPTANGAVNGTANGVNRDEYLPVQFSKADIYEYFIVQGNWRYLLGTSVCWFLLDFAFYGLGMGNPRTVAKLWTFYPSQTPLGPVPSWNPNPSRPDATIYQALKDNALQNIYTVSIASVLGSVLMIFVINYIPRKQFLTYSFLWLSLLFAATGGSFFTVFHTDAHAVSIVLVALCHFSFNFGANTLTFIIPSEVFPTRYRCTCHGIAAASGKAGSIIIQAVLPRMSFNGVLASNPNSDGLGWIFIIFAFVMASGAIFSWAWLPNLQNPRDDEGGMKLPNKTLEELGGGLRTATEEGQIIGFRKKLGRSLHEVGMTLRRRGTGSTESHDQRPR